MKKRGEFNLMKKLATKKALASLAIMGMVLASTPFNAFANTGVITERLFGTDRFGTAIAVSNAGWTTSDTAILAPSANANLVDALAAAPLAGTTSPILLTEINTLNTETKAELERLGVTEVYVVGAISQAVADEVAEMDGITVTVLKGDDRIGTATAIASELTDPAGSFVVGYNALADALSVASYAAANNYSILVANPDGSLPDSQVPFLGDEVFIIGGPTLVQDIELEDIEATRIYGTDRFDTNQDVLNAFTYNYENVYVANGKNAHLVDSLVASSLAAMSGAPIVLTDTDKSAAALDVHAKLAANAVVTALGGDTVVSDEVLKLVSEGEPASSVTLAEGSLGTAGDMKITGLEIGTKYVVTIGDDVFGVQADGTLGEKDSAAEALLGTEITGLTNGTTYRVAVEVVI